MPKETLTLAFMGYCEKPLPTLSRPWSKDGWSLQLAGQGQPSACFQTELSRRGDTWKTHHICSLTSGWILQDQTCRLAPDDVWGCPSQHPMETRVSRFQKQPHTWLSSALEATATSSATELLQQPLPWPQSKMLPQANPPLRTFVLLLVLVTQHKDARPGRSDVQAALRLPRGSCPQASHHPPAAPGASCPLHPHSLLWWTPRRF